MQKQLVPAAPHSLGSISPAWPLRLVKRLATQAAAAAAIFLDAYAAAAQFDELSRLSDAELARRGLSRADIHRLVSATATEHAHDHRRRWAQD